MARTQNIAFEPEHADSRNTVARLGDEPKRV